MPATTPKPRTISVREFFENHSKSLGLKLVAGEEGLSRIIREPTVNRPGLALTGFFSYFAPKRVQVFGSAELSYLKSLSKKVLHERLQRFLKTSIPCLVVSRNAKPPPALLQLANNAGIPVFNSPMITMRFINAATIAIEADFAPRRSEHGSMVDILGVGTLIRGASGIGKSECVLSLLERGYSLVSDDITRFRTVEGRQLLGNSAELTRFHMEVRGIGIINVASIFGVRSIRTEKTLDLVVTLKDWDEMKDIDRHGLNKLSYKILDISVPHVIIPVRMGRDLGHLVEVAALDYKLKSHGIDSAKEFNERLIQSMQTNK